MSIRARLAISVALVLAVAFVLLGTFLVRSTRATLMDQVDDRLLEVSYNAVERKPYGPSAGGDNGYGGDGEAPWSSWDESPYQDSSPRLVAEFVFNKYGKCTVRNESGYPDQRDPIPDFPTFPSPEAEQLVDDIVTLPAIDGTLDYRVYVQRNGDDYVAVAAPLDEVDQAVSRVVRTVSFGGAGVLAISGIASWVLIRRGFRPVDRMVDTASAIAGGDLSRRVPESDSRTELGRLGEALNEMLGQIERGVAERAANEERLRRFVADAAHELRTPLTSVRGYAELYRQGALTNDEALAKAMGRIEAEGSRMARLVDDLLLLARLDRQMPLEIGPVELDILAREAVEDFRAADRDHPVELSVTAPAIVSGDRVRLRQVIDNLLTNVRVHTPAGTPVYVTVGRNASFAEVTVEDDGPGIPEPDRPRIFERFWRGDPSRVRRTGGTGLGLAIVQSLATAHGGTVELFSGTRSGAAFRLRLPLDKGQRSET